MTTCPACGEVFDSGQDCQQNPVNDDFRFYLDKECGRQQAPEQPAADGGWPPPFELMKLQARGPETGNWIDIYPAQLEQMLKQGLDIRVIEPPAALAAAPAVGGEAWSDDKLAGWARNWHWNDCAEDKPVDPSIYFRDMRLLKAFLAAQQAPSLRWREEIARIILVDVLDFKKPERAGEHCRKLADNAAAKILGEPL